MTKSWTRVVAALMIGILAGVVAAVVIPTAESTPSDPPFVALTGPITTKPPLRPLPGTVDLRPHPGTVREELRRKDPAGGPDWVLRSMTADRMVPKRFRRPGSDGVSGTGPCIQLLRDVGGKLGWIDGDNVFRPVPVSAAGPMSKCSGPNLDTRRQRVQLFSSELLVSAPTSWEPTIRGQVAWGFVGPHVRRMRLRAGGEVRTPERTPRWGAFLEFYGPKRPAGHVSLRIRYEDGKVVDTGMGRGARRPTDGAFSGVIARAPDPGGGPSWGLHGERSKDGSWCTSSTGHLLGDVIGFIDPKYGVMQGASAGLGSGRCGPGQQPTKAMPIMAMSSSGSYTDVAGLAPNGEQLRLQPGRTLIFGLTHPDIVSLTITTPRDVRTVIPSQPGHGFLVVYDGGFAGGKVTATAHFRDGRTQDVELPGSGF